MEEAKGVLELIQSGKRMEQPVIRRNEQIATFKGFP